MQDRPRVRHRLTKFLLRRGRRAAKAKAWTKAWWEWARTPHFEFTGHEVTFIDCLHEVEHANERIQRLDQAIEEAVEPAPGEVKALITALSGLRGVCTVTAATMVVRLAPASDSSTRETSWHMQVSFQANTQAARTFGTVASRRPAMLTSVA